MVDFRGHLLGVYQPTRGYTTIDCSTKDIKSVLRLITNHTLQPHLVRDVLLNNNNITSLPRDLFRSLRAVRTLDLSVNYIRELDPDVLADLERLTVLRLSKNMLTSLADGVFTRNRRLEELHVDYNFVARYDRFGLLADLPRLEILNFSGNPLEAAPALRASCAGDSRDLIRVVISNTNLKCGCHRNSTTSRGGRRFSVESDTKCTLGNFVVDGACFYAFELAYDELGVKIDCRSQRYAIDIFLTACNGNGHR